MLPVPLQAMGSSAARQGELHACRTLHVPDRFLDALSDLAVAAEERGFESIWVAEHSHIPASRRTPYPGGGELPKMYYEAMDPFVALASARASRAR